EQNLPSTGLPQLLQNLGPAASMLVPHSAQNLPAGTDALQPPQVTVLAVMPVAGVLVCGAPCACCGCAPEFWKTLPIWPAIAKPSPRPAPPRALPPSPPPLAMPSPALTIMSACAIC